MANVTPDTPDYQRGVTGAQKLVALVPSGTSSVVVGIPPNAESLAIYVPQPGYAAGITATGVTTGFEYPSTVIPVSGFETANYSAAVQVSSVVDNQVTISLGEAPTVSWYIVANQGIRLVTELTIRSAMGGRGASQPVDGLLTLGSDGTNAHPMFMDTQGRQYVVPAGSQKSLSITIGNGGEVLPAISGTYIIYGCAFMISAVDSASLALAASVASLLPGVYCSTANEWFGTNFPEGVLTSGPVYAYRANVDASFSVTVRYNEYT